MPRNSAPHFKVLCSVKNHAKMGDVYADNRLFAGWVRLGTFAIEHYGDRTGDEFIVPDRRLCEIFGVGRADIARTSLERLADVSPISAERDGNVWRIKWPNLSKKQFPRREDGTRREGSASATASTTAVNPPVIPPAGGTPTRRKGRTCAPGALSVEQLRKLQAWAAQHEDPDIRRRQQHVPELAQACLDHFRGKGEQRADWLATIRNWVRNQRNFERRDSHGRPKQQSISDAVRSVIGDDLARRRPSTH